jgi:hypothetical protein
MKLKMARLRMLIRESLAEDELTEPSQWGLEDTPVCRSTLTEFLRQHSSTVMVNGEEGTQAQHLMFVDDMEDMGLRDAIEAGDVEMANAVSDEIMLKYPPEGYDPFANDYKGTPPQTSGIN